MKLEMDIDNPTSFVDAEPTLEPTINWDSDTLLRNQVQLSTYADCLGGNLETLEGFVRNQLDGVVGGVHLLPFYPSSADRGFAPLTYKEVDPEFGDWSHVEKISGKVDLCVDFMVNHISQQSPEFQDFKEKGNDSEFASLFIRYNEFWGGEPTKEELALIYTRKPRAPYFDVTFGDGTTEKVWCTFDHEQIDLDVRSEVGQKFIMDQLDALCERGAKLIRLDAVGYVTKKRGTNCFFVEPDVWEVLDDIKAHVRPKGVELLCEVHEHYTMQKLLASHDFWVYDFALPMLCLQGLYDGNAKNLQNWLQICPRKQITTLDTHDGIGVVDVASLMTEEEIDRTKKNMFQHGANMSMRYNSEQFGNLDIYQINCTYYSACGANDDWYLMARAIQFFTPGIPLVYYVGLLVGNNDVERVERTKVGRDVNRHPYELDEAVSELDRPVVKALFELCKFRNSHPTFNGDFELLEGTQASYTPTPTASVAVPLPASGSVRFNLAPTTSGCHAFSPAIISAMSGEFHQSMYEDILPVARSLSIAAAPRAEEEDNMLVMKWTKDDAYCVLEADLKSKKFRIVYTDVGSMEPKILRSEDLGEGMLTQTEP